MNLSANGPDSPISSLPIHHFNLSNFDLAKDRDNFKDPIYVYNEVKQAINICSSIPDSADCQIASDKAEYVLNKNESIDEKKETNIKRKKGSKRFVLPLNFTRVELLLIFIFTFLFIFLLYKILIKF